VASFREEMGFMSWFFNILYYSSGFPDAKNLNNGNSTDL
jgi:hypothetical protein